MSQRFAALEELGQRFEGLSEPPANVDLRRLWPAISAAGLALIAVAVTAIVLLTSSTPAAYAGWSRVPRDAKSVAISRAITRCYHVSPRTPRLGEPVLAESRGRSTGAVYVTSQTVYLCLYNAQYSAVGSYSMGPLRRSPGPNQLSVPYGQSGGGGSGRVPKSLAVAMRHRPVSRATILAWDRWRMSVGGGYYALGQAGDGITEVSFAFTNHKTVVATVEHGWYFAWWPWETDPTSVTVRDTAGIASATMRNAFPDSGGSRPYPICKPGSPGCLFVKLRPVPSPNENTATPVERAIRTCDAFSLTSQTIPAKVFSAAPPTITDVHGIFRAVVTISAQKVYLCMQAGNHQRNVHSFFMQQVGRYGRLHVAPPRDLLSAPYNGAGGVGSGRPGPIPGPRVNGRPTRADVNAYFERNRGGGYGPFTFGQVGADVSAVDFNFPGGHTAKAIIHDGWYFAWWPWLSSPQSVTVRTISGTITSKVVGSNTDDVTARYSCKPGSPGCVFVRTPTVP